MSSCWWCHRGIPRNFFLGFSISVWSWFLQIVVILVVIDWCHSGFPRLLLSMHFKLDFHRLVLFWFPSVSDILVFPHKNYLGFQQMVSSWDPPVWFGIIFCFRRLCHLCYRRLPVVILIFSIFIVPRVRQRVQLVAQELLIRQEHLSSPRTRF